MENRIWKRSALTAASVLLLVGCAQGGGSSSFSLSSLMVNSQLNVENVNSNSVSLSWYSTALASAEGASSTTQFTLGQASSQSFSPMTGQVEQTQTLGDFYFETLGGLTAGVPNWFTTQTSGSGESSPYSAVMSVTPGFGQVAWLGAGHDGWQTVSNNRQFTPFGAVITPLGQLLVPDGYGNRLIQLSLAGDFEGWIGGGQSGWQMGGVASPGKGDGQFSFPGGVAWDLQGNYYISDMNNNRVQKWTATGTYVGWIGGGLTGWQTGAAPPSGSGNGFFNLPSALAMDPTGNLWIADTANGRYQKWTTAGAFVGWIGGGTNGIHTGVSAPGTGNASFDYSYGIVFDESGNIFIGDCGNNRVQKWDHNLNYVGWLGGGVNGWQTGTAPAWGVTDKTFSCPYGITVATDGTIYVADQGGSLQKWSSVGVFEGKIGNGVDGWAVGQVNYQSGYGDRFMDEPSGVAIDPQGNFYVADAANNRIVVINQTGTYQGWYGVGKSGLQTGIAGSFIDYAGEPRSISYPIGISIDSAGNFYVPDLFTYKVTKWNSSGVYQGAIGNGVNGWNISTANSTGSGDRLMSQPISVAVDSSGNVYVSDAANNRIQKWSSAGVYVGWIGGGTSGWKTGAAPAAGATDAAFNLPGNLLIQGNSLLIADRANNRIQKWDITGGAGTYVGWLGGGTSGWKTGTAPAAAAGDAAFNAPGGMDTDSIGDLYVVDIGNNRVQKWILLTGGYGGWFGGSDGWQAGTAPASGSGDRQFKFTGSASYTAISQVGVDKNNGSIYVLDTLNGRLQKWSAGGTYAGWAGNGKPGWSQGTQFAVSAAFLNGQIDTNVQGLAVGADGTVYTSDLFSGKVVSWK